MTDRELLEAAAKAGCIVGEYVEDFGSGDYYYTGKTTGILVTDEDGAQWVWNPLTDDGDALRTAVRLGMAVSVEYQIGSTAVLWGPPMGYVLETHGDDPYAATRRAIVRAAAATAPRS